jgi:hypothetical protein
MYSRTLWVPILAHAVNNSLGVLFAYFNLDEGETINTDTLGTTAADWIWLTASIIITVGLFIIFKKFNKGNNVQPAEEPI